MVRFPPCYWEFVAAAVLAVSAFPFSRIAKMPRVPRAKAAIPLMSSRAISDLFAAVHGNTLEPVMVDRSVEKVHTSGR